MCFPLVEQSPLPHEPVQLDDPIGLAALKNFSPLTDVKSVGQQWKDYGFALFQPDEGTKGLAKAVESLTQDRQLHTERPHLKKLQTRIAGLTLQTALSGLRSPGVRLLKKQFRDLVRSRMAQLGGFPSVGGPLQLKFAGTKSLVSSFGSGEQMIHWDSHQLSVGNTSVTCILYCTDTDSTLLPRFRTLLEFPGLNVQRNDPSRAFLLDRNFFHSVPVKAGSLLLFRHFVPHAGVRSNSRDQHRVLLFDMFTHSHHDMPNPNQQYFHWHFLRDSFGRNSKEFLNAISDATADKFTPLTRETSAEEEALLPSVIAQQVARLAELQRLARERGIPLSDQ